MLSPLRSVRKVVGAVLGCALKHCKPSVLVKERRELGVCVRCLVEDNLKRDH